MGRTTQSILIAIALGHPTCGTAQMSMVSMNPLFGPVVGTDVISGRAEDADGRLMLMVGGHALVAIDLDARTATRTALQIPGARCWGLARLSDGSLWTLRNRQTLMMIDDRGQSQREIGIERPLIGLFAEGERLIYQESNVDAPAPALHASRPGEPSRVPWGDLQIRSFSTLNRVAAGALNMVNCGIGRHGETPCWFPDEPVISLIDPSGRTRRLELAGLDRVLPETLIAAESPRRPVRDGYVDASGTIWVLSSGEPPDPAPDLPGAWVIARYGPHGEEIDRRRLSQPARLILRAGGGRALLLAGNGTVAEVRP
jgi:hypothetical protein